MMLKIKRVPTVVSNHQKEEGEEGSRRRGLRPQLPSKLLPSRRTPTFIYFSRKWTGLTQSRRMCLNMTRVSLQLPSSIRSFSGSGRTVCREGSFAMMSPPAKPR
ncbi:hypothetical protein NC653_028426 [Populus alba x Populus x berolinensis]|uniref:Uncharacterized protein n=1 Tax=Populus alba x Populus x berolinensis TaxID=444605 RepID=A0AAD6Q7F0_9ROSI|nr:hypothetical protein NC653_028426 [Populus alba x Populus x berolinensis]